MAIVGIRAARMHDTTHRIERRLARVGARVSGGQLDQLSDYLLLLERWNQRMNLTALEDQDGAVDRLIVEPVIAAAEIDSAARILVDVGSGGGSPAIPLKIMRQTLALTMIEVKTRKSVFLREVARHLELTATNVETARFEQVLERPEVVGAVDVLSVRAVRIDVAELTRFSQAMRPGGQQLWFLSGEQQLPQLPGAMRVERDLPLVESTGSRLVVVRNHPTKG